MTISVLIAAYNAEGTLAETLASVLDQTLLPDEIIVVDDGSTDHTAKVAAAASNSVRVIGQTNRGPAAALNLGVELATGDLLSFIDADDLWERNKLAIQTRALAEQIELDGVASHVRMFFCPTRSGNQQALSASGWTRAMLVIGSNAATTTLLPTLRDVRGKSVGGFCHRLV